MSASLVGSEMCIRDSLGPLDPPLRRQIQNLRDKCRRAHPSTGSWTGFEAILWPAQFSLRALAAMCSAP
eukprot:12581914-Alexandrium_andersonii.AAC.1